MGIIIAGTNSGCGKTTITCGILQALVNRGVKAASFKCGPDYIDPMFHARVIGTSSYNLDAYFCGGETLRYLFGAHAGEVSVVEGAMGFYDGGEGSAYSLARVLELPAVIVIDCKGIGESVGAVMKGFLSYKPDSGIRGFIFNRLSEKLVPAVRAICAELGTEYLGRFPFSENCVIGSRHLGLITASEIPDLRRKTALLADMAEKFVDINRIAEIANERSPKKGTEPPLPALEFEKPPVIAAARDSAFCFLYRENFELLERLGCELRFFSPISDSALPEGADGLILCGGYPELYARELSENSSMLDSIRKGIAAGLPTIAECGGFLYLHKTLRTDSGERFPLVGAIDAEAFATERLQRFGYAELTAERDNLLCRKGERFRAHEFHYWDSTSPGDSFTAVKPNGATRKCAVTTDTLYAGFPHLYFYANPNIAVNFAKKCAEFAKDCARISPRGLRPRTHAGGI